MIGITFLLLCVGSVFSQYDFYDLPKENDQIDLIQDINNLAPVENTAIQSKGENTVVRELPVNNIYLQDSGGVDSSKFGSQKMENNSSFYVKGNI